MNHEPHEPHKPHKPHEPHTPHEPLTTTTSRSAPSDAGAERRGAPRLTLDRACKVFHRATARFAAARTANVSRTGALLEVRTARHFRPGDELDLVVAWSERGLVPDALLQPALVVRAEPPVRDRQVLAVRYLPGPAAGARAA